MQMQVALTILRVQRAVGGGAMVRKCCWCENVMLVRILAAINSNTTPTCWQIASHVLSMPQ